MPYSADTYARALLGATAHADETTASRRADAFISMIRRHRAQYLLPDIVARYRELAQRAAGYTQGRITTAGTISNERRQEVKETLRSLTGMTVELSEERDSSLLAGFRARAEDFRIEASAYGALQDMATQIKE